MLIYLNQYSSWNDQINLDFRLYATMKQSKSKKLFQEKLLFSKCLVIYKRKSVNVTKENQAGKAKDNYRVCYGVNDSKPSCIYVKT